MNQLMNHHLPLLYNHYQPDNQPAYQQLTLSPHKPHAPPAKPLRLAPRHNTTILPHGRESAVGALDLHDAMQLFRHRTAVTSIDVTQKDVTNVEMFMSVYKYTSIISIMFFMYYIYQFACTTLYVHAYECMLVCTCYLVCICAHIGGCIHKYVQKQKHIALHYITADYIALDFIALHDTALHCGTYPPAYLLTSRLICVLAWIYN